MSEPYFVADEEILEKLGLNSAISFSVLIGPGDFLCQIRWLEQNFWVHAGRPVLDELNRLHREVERLQKLVTGTVRLDDHPTYQTAIRIACEGMAKEQEQKR
jgi:hypothetical protein